VIRGSAKTICSRNARISFGPSPRLRGVRLAEDDVAVGGVRVRDLVRGLDLREVAEPHPLEETHLARVHAGDVRVNRHLAADDLTVVLVDDGTRLAVPLARVRRLEPALERVHVLETKRSEAKHPRSYVASRRRFSSPSDNPDRRLSSSATTLGAWTSP